jgi:hypothetical protein
MSHYDRDSKLRASRKQMKEGIVRDNRLRSLHQDDKIII